MEDFNTWLQDQNRIYNERFRHRAALLESQSVEKPKRAQDATRGYYVVFRLPEHARNTLGEVSEQIAQLTPSITYKPEIMHATLSDYGIVPENEFSQDNDLLEDICQGIEQSLPHINAPVVEIKDLLYNPDTVLFEGQPDKMFFNACKTVIKNCKTQDVDLRDPWGAHITISRFSENKTPDQLQELIKYLKTVPPLNESVALTDLEVGTFYLDPHNLEQIEYQTFKLAV